MRRRLVASEHDEQAALVTWWTIYAQTRGIHPSLLFAIPNGAYLGADPKRRAITMGKLKATGLRPGVPDLMLAIPVGLYHGLYVEMKAEEGTVSVEQKIMLGELGKQGYCTAVAFGFDRAKRVVEGYLQGIR